MTTEPSPLDPFSLEQANQETIELATTQPWASPTEMLSTPEMDSELRSVEDSRPSTVPVLDLTAVGLTQPVGSVLDQTSVAASDAIGNATERLAGTIPSFTAPSSAASVQIFAASL